MYYLVYGIIWLISLLPIRILYVFSDCIYGLVFYVFKYRKEVVMNNLLLAFPEKTEKERKQIAKKFYHNLIDSFIETVKIVSASKKFIRKRFTTNWNVVNDLKPGGKSVQLHMGHNFNWELGTAASPPKVHFPYVGVYMPIKNKIVEKLFYKLRVSSGAHLVRATHMREDFLQFRNKQYLLVLMADQNPGHPGNTLWVNFFGRPTAFIRSPAKAAIANDTAVVFAFIHKPRRGYYEAVLTLAEKTAAGKNEQELTQKFASYMEQVIRQYPDMWLWSHRRWKLEWKPEYGDIIK
jgi:KDO2-lipid IV(A) lauroyltransferase